MSNLYDPHVAVSTFCLYGGVYAQTPNPDNGFYGYVNDDSLDLRHDQGKQLVVYNVAEGAGHWIKVDFGIGKDARYAFFINPYQRTASCGLDGLADPAACPDNFPVNFSPSVLVWALDHLRANPVWPCTNQESLSEPMSRVVRTAFPPRGPGSTRRPASGASPPW